MFLTNYLKLMLYDSTHKAASSHRWWDRFLSHIVLNAQQIASLALCYNALQFEVRHSIFGIQLCSLFCSFSKSSKCPFSSTNIFSDMAVTAPLLKNTITISSKLLSPFHCFSDPLCWIRSAGAYPAIAIRFYGFYSLGVPAHYFIE